MVFFFFSGQVTSIRGRGRKIKIKGCVWSERFQIPPGKQFAKGQLTICTNKHTWCVQFSFREAPLYSSSHAFTYSQTHSFTHSLTRSFIHSFTHPLTHHFCTFSYGQSPVVYRSSRSWANKTHTPWDWQALEKALGGTQNRYCREPGRQ